MAAAWWFPVIIVPLRAGYVHLVPDTVKMHFESETDTMIGLETKPDHQNFNTSTYICMQVVRK